MLECKSQGRNGLLQAIVAGFFRFGCVGGIVFVVDVTLVFLFGRILSPVAAVSTAYVLAVCLHFCLNKRWVFESEAPCHASELLTYSLTAACCWGCTVLCVKLALGWLTNNLLVAKLAAIPPTMVLGFSLMRLVVFRRGKTSPTAD